MTFMWGMPTSEELGTAKGEQTQEWAESCGLGSGGRGPRGRLRSVPWDQEVGRKVHGGEGLLLKAEAPEGRCCH